MIEIDEVGLPLRPLSREDRLLLCVLLQAVSEQDPRNVVIPSRGKERDSRKRAKLANEANAFVQSDEFVTMCRQVPFHRDLTAMLRNATPAQARQAFEYLTNPRANIDEALATVRGTDCRTSDDDALAEIAA